MCPKQTKIFEFLVCRIGYLALLSIVFISCGQTSTSTPKNEIPVGISEAYHRLVGSDVTDENALPRPRENLNTTTISGEEKSRARACAADFDRDGVIDAADRAQLNTQMGKTCEAIFLSDFASGSAPSGPICMNLDRESSSAGLVDSSDLVEFDRIVSDQIEISKEFCESSAVGDTDHIAPYRESEARFDLDPGQSDTDSDGTSDLYEYKAIIAEDPILEGLSSTTLRRGDILFLFGARLANVTSVFFGTVETSSESFRNLNESFIELNLPDLDEFCFENSASECTPRVTVCAGYYCNGVNDAFLYDYSRSSADHLDGDGLNLTQEQSCGSNPNAFDTDDDGLSDFEECVTLGTDASNWDTDHDMWSDPDELSSGTDPLQKDHITHCMTQHAKGYTVELSFVANQPQEDPWVRIDAYTISELWGEPVGTWSFPLDELPQEEVRDPIINDDSYDGCHWWEFICPEKPHVYPVGWWVTVQDYFSPAPIIKLRSGGKENNHNLPYTLLESCWIGM